MELFDFQMRIKMNNALDTLLLQKWLYTLTFEKNGPQYFLPW